MKALLFGSLFAVVLIIGGAIIMMAIDSNNSIDARVVTNEQPMKGITATTVMDTQDTGETGTSAEDALKELRENGPLQTAQDSSKVGYTLTATMGTCDSFIAIVQEEVDAAEEVVKDTKKAYEKAQDRMYGLTNGDDIEEAQEEIKEKRNAWKSAEKDLFRARERLIKARTTCKE